MTSGIAAHEVNGIRLFDAAVVDAFIAARAEPAMEAS